jgi:predicted nicotinamide N-methyase
VAVRSVCADILGEAGPPSPGADLVLAADAFYERDLAIQVTGFLGRCRDLGAGVLVGDLGRRYLPYSRLSALASYEVPGLGALESRDVVRTTVWTLSGPTAPG